MASICGRLNYPLMHFVVESAPHKAGFFMKHACNLTLQALLRLLGAAANHRADQTQASQQHGEGFWFWNGGDSKVVSFKSVLKGGCERYASNCLSAGAKRIEVNLPSSALISVCWVECVRSGGGAELSYSTPKGHSVVAVNRTPQETNVQCASARKRQLAGTYLCTRIVSDRPKGASRSNRRCGHAWYGRGIQTAIGKRVAQTTCCCSRIDYVTEATWRAYNGGVTQVNLVNASLCADGGACLYGNAKSACLSGHHS